MISPFVIVIFGATGDLAKNKLLPVLFSLYQKKQLPGKFYIVGFARREFSNADYINWIGDETEAHHDPAWQDFTKHLFYQQGLFDNRAGYEQLIDTLSGFDKEAEGLTQLFYLATPPDNYATILSHLDGTRLAQGEATRVAIEKPFGKDLQTAQDLEQQLCTIF